MAEGSKEYGGQVRDLLLKCMGAESVPDEVESTVEFNSFVRILKALGPNCDFLTALGRKLYHKIPDLIKILERSYDRAHYE